MFQLFEGFQHKNVPILLLFSMKYSYLLMAKITGILMILSNWGHLAIYFDNTLEEYKFRISDYIRKDDFDGVQFIFCK